ncbi:phosphotransferase enzyme family protein [Candidatus Bipolaricaulota bacterium]
MIDGRSSDQHKKGARLLHHTSADEMCPDQEVSQRIKSVESLVLVGQGRTAEIFEWGEERVLRLFRPGASVQCAQREMRAFRCVNEAELPCPAVYPSDSEDGLVVIEERLGFVMDRVDGPSMLQVLTRWPWKLWPFARALATFHLSMHRQVIPGLPSQRDRFHRVIDRLADELGETLAARLRAGLDRLDDGGSVCHGDFHPDNVILSDRGPVVIDWGPATAGAPAADVAWTVYLFQHGGHPPGMSGWQRAMLTTLRRSFLWVYSRAYFRRSSFNRNEVERWGPVIAAIRLGDGIPEEREFLLRMLQKHFG